MHSEQLIELSTLLLTFLSLLLLVQFAAAKLPSFEPLQALAEATNIMDPNAILAFAVGLVASIAVLIYLNAGSE